MLIILSLLLGPIFCHYVEIEFIILNICGMFSFSLNSLFSYFFILNAEAEFISYNVCGICFSSSQLSKLRPCILVYSRGILPYVNAIIFNSSPSHSPLRF